MDDSSNTHGDHPHWNQYLSALSLRRTLTAAQSLTHDASEPSGPGQPNPHPRGLPLPLVVSGLAVALAATTTTLWALSPWLPWWALALIAPLAAVPGLVIGTIAMIPVMVSTTRASQGFPTGRDWVSPTALTFLACTAPLLSPLPAWCGALALWALLITAALLSTYRALPALGRDIDLERARAAWDTHPD